MTNIFKRLLSDDVHLDSAQQRILEALFELKQALEKTTFTSKINHFFGMSPKAVKGLYIWGGVGRGKTMMMDAFFEGVQVSKKRIHFHRFMVLVHQSLKKYQGKKDPLYWVAKDFKDIRLLCFDEFFVSDIADAMLLGTLLKYLFAQGLTLVATSNVEPSQLYRNGLQRGKFLPAIKLLEKHTQVIHIDNGEDYRLRTLKQAEIYHYPLDAIATENLKRCFAALAPDERHQDTSILIEGHRIQAIQCADSVAWFSFQQLCMGPRSSLDYIELAKTYHTILLSDVRAMNAALDDAAKRFITMVDEFYERHVTLIISAEVPLNALYSGQRLAFEFERTRSRLQEMQSEAYLTKPHLA